MSPAALFRSFACSGPVIFLCGLGLGLDACGSSQTSDTKTNWFRVCETDADCGSEGSCLCAICTEACDETSSCRSGSCGSVLATLSQCSSGAESSATAAQICLPDAAPACAEVPLALNGELGAAVAADCNASGALICEDFDTALPAEFSTWQQELGEAAIQDCEARSGEGALRFRSVDSGWTQVRMRLPTPLDSGTFYTRFYAQLAGESVLPEQLILFELWDGEEGERPERTTLYLNAEQQLEVFVGSSMRTVTADSMAPLQPDTWHCIEFSVELSDTAGAVQVNLDEATVLGVTDIDTLQTNPVVVAVLESLPSADSSGTDSNLLIDDLVISTEPIGCD